MRRQGQPALRMIGRSQPVKAPQGSRERAIAERFALAPPDIPETSHVVVSRGLRAWQFVRQQAARAEQSKQSSIKTNTELVAQAEQTGRLVEYAKSLLSAVRVFKLSASA